MSTWYNDEPLSFLGPKFTVSSPPAKPTSTESHGIISRLSYNPNLLYTMNLFGFQSCFRPPYFLFRAMKKIARDRKRFWEPGTQGSLATRELGPLCVRGRRRLTFQTISGQASFLLACLFFCLFVCLFVCFTDIYTQNIDSRLIRPPPPLGSEIQYH